MKSFSPVTAAQALWQMRIKKRPFVLSHGITSSCNLRCSFCRYWRQPGPEMSTAAVLNMLDEAADYGLGVYNAWTAEPLMREDLPLILSHARSRGLVTSLVTNGLLLEKRLADLRDLDMLSVSLDGIKSYQELRGIDPAPVLQGIRGARKAGHEILINCVISGKNIAELEDLVHLAESLGSWISFEPMHPSPEISQEVWQSLSVRDIPQFEAVIERLMDLKKSGAPLINSLTYLQMIKDSQRQKSMQAGRQFACHAPEIIMHVAADGTVGACRVHQDPLGNVKCSLARVWEDTREKRKQMAGQCAGCLFFGYVENSLLYDFVPEVMRHYQWM
jgi:MoaA/NifB/PqqE/SkfB family radical SAM enzyme